MSQESCIRGKQWNEPSNEDQRCQCNKWFIESPDLLMVKASCLSTSDAPPSLHIFTNASSSAYTTTTYVHQEQPNSTAIVTLAAAKDRPAPIKGTLIPKSELQVGVPRGKLSTSVGIILDIPPEYQHFSVRTLWMCYIGSSHPAASFGCMSATKSPNFKDWGGQNLAPHCWKVESCWQTQLGEEVGSNTNSSIRPYLCTCT